MFTVKWVVRHADGEVTRMFTADSITAAYREPDHTPDPAKPRAFWEIGGRFLDEGALLILGDTDLSSRSINCGIAYVMNDAGATVAKFHLSDRIMPVGSCLDVLVAGATAPTA